MIILPLSSLSPSKRSLLQKSSIRPPTYLSVEGTDYDPLIQATLYELEIGVLYGTDIIVQRTMYRFSSLKKLDDRLRPRLYNIKLLMPFPPKRYFGNFKKDFVDERAAQIHFYLQGLMRIPGIQKIPEFTKFFHLNINDGALSD